MSLATRLSAFFLVALGLVLGGFSGALYVLASTYLGRQLDERLTLALDTLEASVDIEPGGLEWEPTDRQMTLGVDAGDTAVRWAVRDEKGALVDRSANARRGTFPAGWSPASWPADAGDGTSFGGTRQWRLAGRRLRLEQLLRKGRGHPNDEPGYEKPYRVLDLVVGLEPAPMVTTLGRLALALAVLSTTIWAAAAVVGRSLCLRALGPVQRMASAATDMSAADLGRRLPVAGTHDEFEEFGRAFNDLLDRLQAAFGQLHDAYEQQQRFAGHASHQLRTPLAALLGQVQVALRRDRSPEEYRRTLDQVQVEGVRLRQIIESLLFLAQPEGVRPELETVDLAAWVDDQLPRWAVHARGADIRAEIDESRPLTVRAHPPLLGQLLENLLENACKYSAAGTPIVVRARGEGGSIVLEVEDRGHGLAAEDLTRVFEPFYRTDQARREGHPGVGLGLAVAERIAGALGGTLSVRSQPGSGSVFCLRLPGAAAVGLVETEENVRAAP